MRGHSLVDDKSAANILVHNIYVYVLLHSLYTMCTDNKMDAAAELERNSVSKHQIQPEYGNEQADVGQDCPTRLVRPNTQARTGIGNDSFSLFS